LDNEFDKKKVYARYRLERAKEEYETAIDMLRNNHFRAANIKCTPLSRQIFLNFKLDFRGVIEAQSTPSHPSLGYPLSVDI